MSRASRDVASAFLSIAELQSRSPESEVKSVTGRFMQRCTFLRPLETFDARSCGGAGKHLMKIDAVSRASAPPSRTYGETHKLCFRAAIRSMVPHAAHTHIKTRAGAEAATEIEARPASLAGAWFIQPILEKTDTTIASEMWKQAPDTNTRHTNTRGKQAPTPCYSSSWASSHRASPRITPASARSPRSAASSSKPSRLRQRR